MLIACLACQIMHIARRVLAKATGTGWSLRRLRERVLRAGARLVISGRRMTLALSSAAAPFRAMLWPGITALHWAGPWRPGTGPTCEPENARRPPIVMRKRRLPAAGTCQKQTRGRDGPANHRPRPHTDPEKSHRGRQNRLGPLLERGSMNIPG